MPESQKLEELPTEILDRLHDQREQAPGALHNLSNSLDLKGYEVFRVDNGDENRGSITRHRFCQTGKILHRQYSKTPGFLLLISWRLGVSASLR